MFRLSKTTDYGIVLMAQLANHASAINEARPVDPTDRSGDSCSKWPRALAPQNARELAESSDLPVPMVSKILKALTKEGLLISQRGSKGGYSLARSPEQISAAEMISALDGPIGLTECAVHPGQCVQEPSCQVREPWKRINAVVHHALNSVTLAELAQPALANAALHADVIPLSDLGLHAPEHAEP
jgi:FeS assembly SUF system regulator